MKFCPKCGNKSFRVKESRTREANVRRRTPATRVRRQCGVCGHVDTFFEIDSAQMKHFEALQRLEEAVVLHLQLDDTDSCYACIHWDANGCSMHLPEAGGTFATECSLFQKS